MFFDAYVEILVLLRFLLQNQRNPGTDARIRWYSVKKKYKLNVNFFHNTILNLQLILNSLALSDTYPHIHLGIGIHNDCVF